MKNRKIITSVLTLCFAGLAFYFNDWTRLVFIVLTLLSLVLFSNRMVRLPKLLWNHILGRDPLSISDQRWLDLVVLPIITIFLIIAPCITVVKITVTALNESGRYHPHWKSEINNMYANRFMGYVVNKVFPVKQYYSTKK